MSFKYSCIYIYILEHQCTQLTMYIKMYLYHEISTAFILLKNDVFPKIFLSVCIIRVLLALCFVYN